MTVEGVGAFVTIVLGALALAAIGGALVWRFKSGGEKAAVESYQNAVDAYKEELEIVGVKQTRLESENVALKARAVSQDKVIASQGEQLTMLRTMVQGVEAISDLEKRIDGQFDALHKHLNRLWGDKS